MIFTMTLKDPDGIDTTVRDAARQSIETSGILDEDEQEALYDIRVGKISKFLSKWVSYGEYITLEFDTETESVTVRKAK